jgi:heme exporter protein C
VAEPGTFRADTFKTDTFKTWFHRWGSPRWFYERSLRWSFWFGFSAFLILGVAWIWGLGFAPVDHRQGNSYRIMFLHVPNVFMAMSNYLLMATSGAIAMIWKIKLADWVMKRAATIGACFTLIALFTGVVWGKATWGGFLWSDSKILFTVLLLFLYLGVLALKASYQSEEMANKAATILALVGVVNIPIIYFAADWFFSLHQRSGSSMPPSMAWPFWLSVLGGYCFYAWVLLRSVRAEIVQREYKTQWVKELIQEVKA